MAEQKFDRLVEEVRLSVVAVGENFWPEGNALYVAPRPENQLFFDLEGERTYCETAEGEPYLTVHPGEFLLMPTGSRYWTRAVSPGGNRGLAVLFGLYDAAGAPIVLGERVRMATRDESGYYAECMYRLRDCMLKGGYSALMARGLLWELLYHVATDQPLMQLSPRRQSIMPAVRYMEEHLQRGVSVDELAAMCFMSKSTFHRRFQAEFHTSPTAWHLAARIEKSRELLGGGLYSVEQVAEIMGFCDAAYFSRLFRRYTGLYAGECRTHRERQQR